MSESKPQDIYRETVFLPTTSFPMRGNLPKREPEILNGWESGKLDETLFAQAQGRDVFMLHDGPPYALSLIHI